MRDCLPATCMQHGGPGLDSEKSQEARVDSLKTFAPFLPGDERQGHRAGMGRGKGDPSVLRHKEEAQTVALGDLSLPAPCPGPCMWSTVVSCQHTHPFQLGQLGSGSYCPTSSLGLPQHSSQKSRIRGWERPWWARAVSEAPMPTGYSAPGTAHCSPGWLR